jgi:hypothetical protein
MNFIHCPFVADLDLSISGRGLKPSSGYKPAPIDDFIDMTRVDEPGYGGDVGEGGLDESNNYEDENFDL